MPRPPKRPSAPDLLAASVEDLLAALAAKTGADRAALGAILPKPAPPPPSLAAALDGRTPRARGPKGPPADMLFRMAVAVALGERKFAAARMALAADGREAGLPAQKNLVHAFNKLGTGAVGAARQFVATLAMGALYRAERSDDAAEFWRVLEHVEALNAMAGGALLAVFTSFGTENP